MQRLGDIAYDFAIEIREGKWDHVSDPHTTRSMAATDALIVELRRRCPGHTRDAYAKAIADGLVASK